MTRVGLRQAAKSCQGTGKVVLISDLSCIQRLVFLAGAVSVPSPGSCHYSHFTPALSPFSPGVPQAIKLV